MSLPTCPTCIRNFLSAKALSQHLSSPVHTQYCHTCNRKFYTPHSLNQHLSSAGEHNPAAAQPCHDCGGVFKDGHAWRQHRNAVHGDVWDLKAHFHDHDHNGDSVDDDDDGDDDDDDDSVEEDDNDIAMGNGNGSGSGGSNTMDTQAFFTLRRTPYLVGSVAGHVRMLYNMRGSLGGEPLRTAILAALPSYVAFHAQMEWAVLPESVKLDCDRADAAFLEVVEKAGDVWEGRKSQVKREKRERKLELKLEDW